MNQVKIEGIWKEKLVMVWSVILAITIYAISVQVVGAKQMTWSFVIEISASLLVLGLVASAYIWITDILLETRLFFDGDVFKVKSKKGISEFKMEDIFEFQLTNLSDSPKAKLVLEDGTEVNILSPMWMRKVTNKEEFCDQIKEKFKRANA